MSGEQKLQARVQALELALARAKEENDELQDVIHVYQDVIKDIRELVADKHTLDPLYVAEVGSDPSLVTDMVRNVVTSTEHSNPEFDAVLLDVAKEYLDAVKHSHGAYHEYWEKRLPYDAVKTAYAAHEDAERKLRAIIDMATNAHPIDAQPESFANRVARLEKLADVVRRIVMSRPDEVTQEAISELEKALCDLDILNGYPVEVEGTEFNPVIVKTANAFLGEVRKLMGATEKLRTGKGDVTPTDVMAHQEDVDFRKRALDAVLRTAVEHITSERRITHLAVLNVVAMKLNAGIHAPTPALVELFEQSLKNLVEDAAVPDFFQDFGSAFKEYVDIVLNQKMPVDQEKQFFTKAEKLHTEELAKEAGRKVQHLIAISGDGHHYLHQIEEILGCKRELVEIRNLVSRIMGTSLVHSDATLAVQLNELAHHWFQSHSQS